MSTAGADLESGYEPKCAVCKKVESGKRKLLLCSRCKKKKYCSKGCQQEHWPTHKNNCKAQNYILKVDLDPERISDPSISRTLSCPATATFEELHWALQVTFGWASTHNYDFKIKNSDAEPEQKLDLLEVIARRKAQDLTVLQNTLVSNNGPRQNLLRIIEKNAMRTNQMHTEGRTDSQTPEISSKKIKLSKVFESKEYEGAEIEYEYDFGNCWTHEITLVGRGDATTSFKCLDGEGHGVAEDVGSTRGWEELKEAYRAANPTQEQKDRRHWFENQASNRDRRGLGNGLEILWDKDAINANLQH